MEDFNLTGNADNNAASTNVETGMQFEETFRLPLDQLGQKEIIQIFSRIRDEGRRIVIVVGFPQAGKSLFISSLAYYAEKCATKKWEGIPKIDYPYDWGNKSRNRMIEYFDNAQAYPATKTATLDIIGIDVQPHRKNLPTLKLAFVDLAGEDLEKIKVSSEGSFRKEIEGIFNACGAGTIFCMITPFAPAKGDSAENALHSNFLTYMRQRMPNLYDQSKFIVVVTQWDKNGDLKMSVEDYIEKKREALCNALQGRKKKDFIYCEYSVGEVFDTFEKVTNSNGIIEEKPVILINRISYDYPHNFWNGLYQLGTGKSLEPSGCLGKFFGF